MPNRMKKKMKPPRAHARGIFHLFGGIRRSTLLRSLSFGGSALRIHPWAYAHSLLRRRIKSENNFWIILGVSAVLALLVIFYSLNSFYDDFRKQSESMNALVIPKNERALIEINFGNGKKRVFAGAVKNEVYPLETALKSAAESGKFTFEIKKGFIQRVAEIGNSPNSWTVYKNNTRVTDHIDQLTITGGDRYMFKLEK